jgi:hypothetical protein
MAAKKGGKMTDNELYQKAIDKNGRKYQMLKSIEETAELQKEVCKIIIGDESDERILKLAEEVADVENMVAQLKLMFNISDKVEIIKKSKMIRLKRMLE